MVVGSKQMVGFREKSVTMMKDILQKVSKPIDMIFDAFKAMLSTAEGYLLIDKH